MKFIATCFMAIGLAACGATGRSGSLAPTATAPEVDVITLRVPQTVAAFTMARRHDYPDAANGVQLRFQGPDDMVADVYVYPGPDLATGCALGCARDVMKRELADFEESIPEMIRLGYVQAATITARDSLVPTPGALWQLGHHLTLAVERDGGPKRSDLYLYYLPGFRLKVRATYVESPGRLESLQRFLEQVVPALLARESSTTG